MFCACGTLVSIKSNTSELKCNRCDRTLALEEIKEISMHKDIIHDIKIDLKEVKGAKIKYQCPNCGADEMMYNTAQLRSADEGQTVFYSCECGYKQTVQS
ncbi:DNA-directed RNA polymerase I subunit RPA12 [Nosema granulosis]|uniref:DNA-directed RNA polymerase I subunit RPA12 n=1 Tax=Nosema granulosis TaxID=83296 RepID=A0A9P6L087_9MICR|nr:DNA-directed RNA polymerase I subunit RPA12 [Nosema granulosis]